MIARKGWFYLNVASLIACSVAGPFISASLSLPKEDEKLVKSLILSAVCALAIVCYCGFVYIVSPADSRWLKPSLRHPPYFSKQPIQTFYVGSFQFLAMSAGCLVGSAWLDSSYAWILFASIGAGTLLGVILSELIYSKKTST